NLIFLCLLVAAFPLQAQELAGDIRLSVDFSNIPMDSAMAVISSHTGLQFAYSSDRIDTSVPITLHAKDEPLTLILQKLAAAAQCHYMIRRSRILLLPGPAKPVKPGKTYYVLSGFIREQSSGMIGATLTIDGASEGTVTNAYGYYSLPLATGNHHLTVSYIGYKSVEIPFDLSQNLISS
ncbi:MAG: hypothetical protein GXO83_12395, partial [Chlorobi bacterium]|nr:hypothetical protein [Chlorobiota bacterium]